MKADLTRSTFRPEKHYSGVRMQQGRVQLDADWNEQVDIGAHLDVTTRIDVIGRCGMPEDDAGFEVTPSDDGSDLLLSPGRAYVDGVLCESDASPISADVKASKAQLDSLVADGRPIEVGDWLAFSATGVGPFVVRIASIDEASLSVAFVPPLATADVTALHDAGDAVGRRLASFMRQPDFPGPPPKDLTVDEGLYLVYLDVWERHVTALEDGVIREIALGGPDTASRTQTVWQVKLERLGDPDADITCETVPDWSTFIDESTALLRARAQPETTSSQPCTIPPGAGYRRLENQLYRVEISTSGNINTATFVWSRENGSVLVGAQVTDSAEITVSSLGRDEVLGLAPGSWIELTDDTHELAGEPGTLVRITSISGNVLTVDTSSSGALDAALYPSHPKVRRWDDPSGPRKVTIPAANQGFLALEDGVEVRFESGRRYATGDYWLIPARTATGNVEWPENGATPIAPLGRPPQGITHHRCRLALLRFAAEQWGVVEDCRQLFPPLTGLHELKPDPGVHVVRVRSRAQGDLRNDTDIAVTDFAEGIEIECDRDVEPNTLVNKPTLLFTIDLPWPLSSADQELWGELIVGTVPVTLDGVTTCKGNLVVWEPSDPVRRWLLDPFRDVMIHREIQRTLLHLTLKGNFVYGEGDPSFNVDGEAFGLLVDGTLEAVLPSGDGRRGGTLDLWFWLQPVERVTTDRVMVVPLTKSRVLTTVARRTGVPASIGLTVDRERLDASLPDPFTVDLNAVVDPAKARTTLARLKLGESPVRMAVDDTLRDAADLIVTQLRENDIPLQLQIEPVGSVVEAFPAVMEAGFDLILADQRAVDAITETAPGELAFEVAVEL